MTILTEQPRKTKLYAVPTAPPPVQCLPWCEHGDGHARALFAHDQACTSGGEELITPDAVVESYAIHHHDTGQSLIAVGLFPTDEDRPGCEVQLDRAYAVELARQILAADAALGATR